MLGTVRVFLPGGDAYERSEATRALAIAGVALTLAVASGAAVAVSPTVGFALAFLGLAAVWIVALGARIERVFLAALGLAVLGYAFLGRGFAYRGVPPIYVGEIVLGIGVVASISALRLRRLHPLHLALVAFMLWGALRTVPYIGTYQLDALRDAVVWGYGAFAIAVSLTVRREHVVLAVSWFERLLPIFVVWAPLAILLSIQAGDPDSSAVPFLFVKTGDIGVILAAGAAFTVVGLGLRQSGVRELLFWLPWLGTTALVGAVSRGGMLAALSSGAALLFVRSSIRWVRVVLVTVVLIAAFGLVNPEVNVGLERRLSFQQLATNMLSIVIPQHDEIVDGTKEWRLRWWNKIFSYTLNGPYYWRGKGFGINLADDDGFQVLESGALREPHNGHIAILARSGVPGLILWVLVQGGYALSLVRAAWIARRHGQVFWLQLFGVLFVYWLASMVNMAFDVYLEGPQGGIPFWSSIGLGLAAIRLAAEDRRTGRSEPRPGPAWRPNRAVRVQPLAVANLPPGPAVPLIRPNRGGIAPTAMADAPTPPTAEPKKRSRRVRQSREPSGPPKRRRRSKPRRSSSSGEGGG